MTMPTLLFICGVLVALGGALVAIPRIYRASLSISRFLVAIDSSTPILMKLVEDYVKTGPWIPISKDVSTLAHEAMKLATHHGEVLEHILVDLKRVALAIELTTQKAASKVEQVASQAVSRVEQVAQTLIGTGETLNKQDVVLAEIQKDLSEVKESTKH